MDLLRIIADDRERKSGIPDLLKKVGINLEIKTLSVGDYIVASETAIERKSIHDFVSSVFDGRLFDQCSRMREHYNHPVLVLEGDIDELDSILDNVLVFYGAVSSVALDYHIPVIPTPSAMHTARLLASMATRKGAAKGPLLKKIRKFPDMERQQLTALCSLPGIAETLAQRMLDKFGTPMNALSASSVDLAKVPGLGKARAERIRKVLDARHTPSDDKQGRLS